ncbi:hypothetical protein Q7M45_05205 [Candidatus Liberibacter asiaticus]|uniref:hypothetical protein n=1 Tax=Liberibacter asiaticus TaxID=34021 RepID=UPI001FCE68A1|nr:hypothetical protein [Candidatus Liberibacter asiaticus]
MYQSVLTDDFSKYGRKVIKNLREEKPEQYLRLISQILPREKIKQDGITNGDQLTDEQLCEIIRSLEKELQIFTDFKNKDAHSRETKETTKSASS